MKTLRRYTRLWCSFGPHYRHFSVLANVKPQCPTLEDLVYVSARVAHVSSLHEMLQLFARTRVPMKGKACHAQVVCVGLQTDIITANMLIAMYAKCGLVDCARKVFDKMPERSLVSWNTMIGSLAQNGEEQDALSLFVEMQREGISFSEFTVSSVLCACAAKCAMFECKQLHAFAIKAAMDFNVFVLVYGSSNGAIAPYWSKKLGKYPIPWLNALAFFFAHEFIKTGLGNRIANQLVVGANLTFNTIKQTIGWTDWAKVAIVPGLVSLIVGVICNGSGDPIPWLNALAFFFAHEFIKTGLGNRIANQLVVGANLTFNTIKQTIGWTDWAKVAIVPGLVSLIVGVICNGSGGMGVGF
nr:pentatricopeptide repeat-containing protein [Quercus suber]